MDRINNSDKLLAKVKRRNTRDAEKIYSKISPRPLIYIYSPRHTEFPETSFAACIFMRYIVVDVDDNGNYSYNGKGDFSSYDAYSDNFVRNATSKLASLAETPTAVLGLAIPCLLYYNGEKVEVKEISKFNNDSAIAELVYCNSDTEGIRKLKDWVNTNVDKETVLNNIETEIRRMFKVKKRSASDRSQIKESFVGTPEIGKTYWFKHSGGIRCGEYVRSTTSLHCFYVPEVDREVCIPIWANIATTREEIENIERVVDKMGKDTTLPRYMVKDNPVKNPYPPKNRYDEAIKRRLSRKEIDNYRVKIARICGIPASSVIVMENGRFEIHNVDERDAQIFTLGLRRTLSTNVMSVPGRYNIKNGVVPGSMPSRLYTITGTINSLNEGVLNEMKEFITYKGYEIRADYDVDPEEGVMDLIVRLYSKGKQVRQGEFGDLTFENYRQARAWIDKHPLPTSERYRGYLISWDWDDMCDEINISVSKNNTNLLGADGKTLIFDTVANAKKYIDKLISDEEKRKQAEIDRQRARQRAEIERENRLKREAELRALYPIELTDELINKVRREFGDKTPFGITFVEPYRVLDGSYLVAFVPYIEYNVYDLSDVEYPEGIDDGHSYYDGSNVKSESVAKKKSVTYAKGIDYDVAVFRQICPPGVYYCPNTDTFETEIGFTQVYYNVECVYANNLSFGGVREVSKMFNTLGLEGALNAIKKDISSQFKIIDVSQVKESLTSSNQSTILKEAPDMFGYMTDDEMDADDQARRDRLEKELADRRARTVDKRSQWQRHKPTYDEAVKRFQNSAGKILEQLAHNFESGKLLQWSNYETPIVEIYKQYGNDKIVFKPTGDNKKNWLDTIVYSLSTGKVNFNYYKDDIGRYLDAYDQVAKLVDSCASVVSDWVDFIEDQNKQSTDKAINRFLGSFVDNPSNIDCAFDCSNPGHYAHGCRFYIFSVDGKVYHYEDYDSGAYTNKHVHQIRCFDRIDIKNYVWDESNPVLDKVDPGNVGLSVNGDLYSTQYLLGGVVRLSDLTSGMGTPTDKAVRLGYYTSQDGVRHKVYFYCDDRDPRVAQRELDTIVPRGSVQVNVAGQTSETEAKQKGFTLIESSHRKKKKGIHINKNAGNVEHNINMFNMASNPVGAPCNNPVSGPMGGNVGCCESLNESSNIPERAKLISALKTFDRNGKVSERGSWKIANGGYDLAFEVYYKGQPVAQGMSDGKIKTDFDTSEFGFTKEDLKKAICSVFSDMCEAIEPMTQEEYENFLKKSAVECYRGFDILHSTWHIKHNGKEDVWDSYAFIFQGKFFPDEVYEGLNSIEKTRARIDQIIKENPRRFGALEYDRDAATKFEKEFDVMSPQEVADNFGREVKDGDTTYSPNKKYEGLDDDFDMFMRGV